jgi:hypothetical protein
MPPETIYEGPAHEATFRVPAAGFIRFGFDEPRGFKPNSNTHTTRTRTAPFTRHAKIVGLWLLAFSTLSAPSPAAPPNGADPDSPLGQWYRSLHVPHTDRLCCSISDCRPVLAREKDGQWEVYLERSSEILELGNGSWVTVPEDVILKRDNLDGRPIACRTSYGTIRCFVPPPQT